MSLSSLKLAIAHVADALDELAKNRYVDIPTYEEMADVLVAKICDVPDVYMDEEEEHVMVAIGTMLERGLNEAVLLQSIRSHYTWESTITMNECSRKYMNRRNFFRSLLAYAQEGKRPWLEEQIRGLLEEIRGMYEKH